MYLGSFSYRGLRNLFPAEIVAEPGINLFVGDNGAGKSAVLEAIHLLATGKSFRTSRPRNAVAWSDEGFVLKGAWGSTDSLYTQRVQHRFNGKASEQTIGGVAIATRLELLKRFPLIFVGAESLRFFEDGPSFRRRQMDMGGFHVEHAYLDSWRRYRRALSQRNALLRFMASPDLRLLAAWEAEMSLTAVHLYRCRQRFVDLLASSLKEFGPALGLPDGLALGFKPGWDPNVSLKDQFRESLSKDQSAGYTLRGPHRDDLILLFNKRSALNSMSRGQQKAFMLAFSLSMAKVMTDTLGATPTLLLDDLGAELDGLHQTTVLNYLSRSKMQAFVTFVEIGRSLCVPEGTSLFHVKHGMIYKCYNGAVTHSEPDHYSNVDLK